MDDSDHEGPSTTWRRRWIGAGAGIVVLLAVAAAWLVRWDRSASNELILFGNIDVREVDIAFNEADRIVAMHVEEGDSVEAGQLLAELDASQLEHLVLEAEAKLAAQRAVVARLEHGSRPEEIQRARAEVAAADAELANARATDKRFQELAQSNAASQQRADDAHAEYLTARSRLDVARENLRLAIEGPRAEDITAARARLRADENALELARHRLVNTKLYAPTAGIVRTRIVEPGAVVLANTPAYTLSMADPVWVRAYLSEVDLGRVFPGMAAEIISDSFPDRPHAGWVGFISPTAEFTPKSVETPELRTSLVYRTRIYARNPDHTLRQGMPVTVRIQLDQTPAPQAAP
jgi:multidrug resistance efflux pump